MDRLFRIEHGYIVERDGALHELSGDVFGAYSLGRRLDRDLKSLKLLPPVSPSKIVCVGLNYKDHAGEVGKALPPEPQIFFKPPSAVIGPGDPIRVPPGVGRVDHEAELALVVGKRAHRVPRARAFDYILGATCLNDVTAREMQRKESQYTRAKGFDTFAPLGPCIAVGVKDEPRTVESFVNGQKRQSSSTKHLIFPLDLIVEYITFVMTLEPGDVISTGTPEGIGPLVAGDTIVVKVEGVGELSNPVVNEA